MNSLLLEYLKQKGVVINDQQQLTSIAIQIFQQKQRTIRNLQQQITRYKCEDIKNQKLIKSLQDKITQLAPSISDTGSNFMMASQFKTSFEEVMTTLLPSAMGTLIGKPYLFSKCVQDIFMITFNHIQHKISTITTSICKLLNINEQSAQRGKAENKIKISLIKVLQEYWEKIVPPNLTSNLQYINSHLENRELVQELNQIINTEEYLQLRQHLHKLVVYMILQDKKWDFIGLNSRQIVKYAKRQYNCIDGWIKEGSNSLMILEGLKRDGHLHANLKNYVIPLQQGIQQASYDFLTLQEKQQQDKPCTLRVDELQKLNSLSFCEIVNIQKIVQKEQLASQQVSMLSKNKSFQGGKEDKQNCSHYLNKKSKKKDKVKKSLQKSLKEDKSPRNKRRPDESARSKKLTSEEVEDKIALLKQDGFPRKKHSTLIINKNISNSHDNMFEDVLMLPLKRKPLEELPVSKQMPLRKKTKPATSRKNSVGKIVNQHNFINNNNNDCKDKENAVLQLNVTKNKTRQKQKAYKDIIKQKMLEDKMIEKTQNSLTILFPKQKSERDKKKDENRPLKIQSNANKLRQKYIF